MARQAKRIKRTLTDAQRQKYRKMREQLDEEKDEILAEARRRKTAHDAAAADLRQAFQVLKAERIAQGLSLADMRNRTGIGRSALSRLENDETANPTIVTLTRYADALGKKLSIALAEKEGSESMT